MHFNLLDLNEFKAVDKGLAIPLCLFVCYKLHNNFSEGCKSQFEEQNLLEIESLGSAWQYLAEIVQGLYEIIFSERIRFSLCSWNSKELEKRVSSERFNKAILHMYVGLFLLNAIDWNKNPCGIIPVSTVEKALLHLWIAIF